MHGVSFGTFARCARVAALVLAAAVAACGDKEPEIVQTAAPPPPQLLNSGMPASRPAQDVAAGPVAAAPSRTATAAAVSTPTQTELATEGRAIGEKVIRAWAP